MRNFNLCYILVQLYHQKLTKTLYMRVQYRISSVSPRFSNGRLTVNFEIGNGGLFIGSLFEGRGLIEKVYTLHRGLFKTACLLHAIIILV